MSRGWKVIVVALVSLAVGRDATTQVRFHERHSRPSSGALRGFACNGGLMIAVGDGGRVLTSADGRTWTARISGTAMPLHGAAHGGRRFVAVGEHGTIVCSDDGVDWRASSDSGTADHLYGVTYGKGRFVAVGDYGVVMTSLDGDAWHVSLDYAHAFTPDDIREAATRLGAFPLTEGGRDAAGLITLSSGSFSIEVGTAAGLSGVVLVEIYDTNFQAGDSSGMAVDQPLR